MVLNSSVKRNVSTKNREEVGDRERGEGRIFAYASGAGAKRGGGLRGRGGREKSAIAPSPFHVLLIPFLLRRQSEHKNFLGLCDTFVTKA